MAFAIIKSAGTDKGLIRSVHKGFNAAMKAQPAIYFALVKCEPGTKKGERRPELLRQCPWYSEARA